MAEDHPSGADLNRYLEPYRRRVWLVLAIVVLLPVAVYVISKQLPKTYEAQTILLTRATTVSSAVFGSSGSLTTGSPTDALTLVGTTAVAERARKELERKGGGAGELSDEVSASLTNPDDPYSSEFIAITVQDEDPVRAADTANAYAAALGATRANEAKTEIRKTISRIERQAGELPPDDQAGAEALSTQLQELRGLLASQADSTQVIEPATPPTAPISPRPRQNTALAFVLAVLLAAGAVPLADALNRRLRDASELEPLLGVSMLAQIPERAFPGHVPGSEVRESFQTLRASLTYFNLDRELEVILITSPGHGEGKTTVSTNLAVAMARDGSHVIVVDGDLRKPQAAARLGVEPALGLEEVLIGDAKLDDALIRADVEGGSLRVLGASGPARNPAILLGSQRMRNVLDEVRQECDLVVVDTPPLLAVSDAIPLLKEVSGSVLVGQVNRTHTNALSKAQEVIAAAGGTVLGSVVTGAKSGGLYGYGGYGGYEAYGDEEPTKEKRPKRRARKVAELKGRGGHDEETPPSAVEKPEKRPKTVGELRGQAGRDEETQLSSVEKPEKRPKTVGELREQAARKEGPAARSDGTEEPDADAAVQSLRDRLSRY